MGASQFFDYDGHIRPIIQDVSRPPLAGEIPIVDIADFLRADASSAEKERVVEQVRDACQNVGFFYLKGHGIPQEVFDGALGAGKRYFDQPLDKKMECYFRKSTTFRGYEPGKDPELNPNGHLKEAFYFSYEPQMDPLNPSDSMEDHVKANPTTSFNQWPSSSPGFREGVSKHFSSILVLGRQVMQIFAVALGLPQDYFQHALRIPSVAGRILKYPCQAPDDFLSEGVDAHCDIQCVTFLLQGGDASALQVLNKTGEWVDAPPIPGTLVLNVGDLLTRWTNGSFASTPHRVVNKSGQERYSMAVFFGAALDTVVDPLSTCITPERPKKYAPITAGEWNLRRLALSRLRIPYDERQSMDEIRILLKPKDGKEA